MKNPVLHIKKGIELYDAPSAGRPSEPARRSALGERGYQGKAPRTSRRRGRMTLFPLLVLAIALVFVFRLIPRAPTNRATLGGWDVVLRATPYGEALLVSVTFTQGAASAAAAAGRPAPLATVRFILPDTGEHLTLADDIPKSPTTLRARLHYGEGVNKVVATVSVGTDTRTLTLAARTAP
jgi:hypothetical protein